MRYVELNPVRAGMVRDAGGYEWRSHWASALGRTDPTVTHHDLYRSLGDTDTKRANAYRALFNVALTSADIELIRETTNKNWALGNDRFRREIEGLVGRRPAPARRTRSSLS